VAYKRHGWPIAPLWLGLMRSVPPPSHPKPHDGCRDTSMAGGLPGVGPAALAIRGLRRLLPADHGSYVPAARPQTARADSC
jgi:hypothetical protein